MGGIAMPIVRGRHALVAGLGIVAIDQALRFPGCAEVSLYIVCGPGVADRLTVRAECTFDIEDLLAVVPRCAFSIAGGRA